MEEVAAGGSAMAARAAARADALLAPPMVRCAYRALLEALAPVAQRRATAATEGGVRLCDL